MLHSISLKFDENSTSGKTHLHVTHMECSSFMGISVSFSSLFTPSQPLSLTLQRMNQGCIHTACESRTQRVLALLPHHLPTLPSP